MIGLRQAAVIVAAARRTARILGLQPLTVAVLDAAGCLVALEREDGSSLLRPQIAQAKAWGALGMGMGTRALAQRAKTHPDFIAALGMLAEGKLLPVPGGVLIRDAGRAIIGAVGISGDHADRDEECAVAAIAEAGLQADAGGDRAPPPATGQ